MRMRRRLVVLVAGAVMLGVMSGCSASPVESRLDEFQPRAEAVHSQVIEALPVDATAGAPTSEVSIDESEWLVPRERQAAFSSIVSIVSVGATGARETARLAGTPLLADGWTVESTSDSSGFFADTYRLNDAGGGE